jgi:hypothetical protein
MLRTAPQDETVELAPASGQATPCEPAIWALDGRTILLGYLPGLLPQKRTACFTTSNRLIEGLFARVTAPVVPPTSETPFSGHLQPREGD